jgi:hypothetical protein
MRSSFKYMSLVVLLAISAVSVSGQVFAQASECGKERKAPNGTLDEPTYKKLNDIYEDVGAELYDIAYDKLIIMTRRAKGKYLKATLFQMLAQVEWARSNFDVLHAGALR